MMTDIQDIHEVKKEDEKANAQIRLASGLIISAPMTYLCVKRWKRNGWYKAGAIIFGLGSLSIPFNLIKSIK